MKCIMFLLSALAGIMLSNAASVSDDFTNRLANYTIVDLQWIVPISPDRNDTVIGTIEDVAKHLAMVDPEGFAAVNKSINEAIAAPFPDSPAVSYSSSDDPGMYDPVYFGCGVYTNRNANGLRIKDGIAHLRTVKGTPVEPPGTDACGRVSCSWNSAIYWCNDSPGQIELDSFGRIADGAQALIYDCCFIQDDGKIPDFNGHISFGGQWQVMVHSDDC